MAEAVPKWKKQRKVDNDNIRKYLLVAMYMLSLMARGNHGLFKLFASYPLEFSGIRNFKWCESNLEKILIDFLKFEVFRKIDSSVSRQILKYLVGIDIGYVDIHTTRGTVSIPSYRMMYKNSFLDNSFVGWNKVPTTKLVITKYSQMVLRMIANGVFPENYKNIDKLLIAVNQMRAFNVLPMIVLQSPAEIFGPNHDCTKLKKLANAFSTYFDNHQDPNWAKLFYFCYTKILCNIIFRQNISVYVNVGGERLHVRVLNCIVKAQMFLIIGMLAYGEKKFDTDEIITKIASNISKGIYHTSAILMGNKNESPEKFLSGFDEDLARIYNYITSLEIQTRKNILPYIFKLDGIIKEIYKENEEA